VAIDVRPIDNQRRQRADSVRKDPEPRIMRSDLSSENHAEKEAEQGSGSAPPSNPTQWLDLHGDALYRFARARVARREAAEDLVQETLLAALQSIDRFQGNSLPRTWLLAILRRKIADLYRRDPTAASELRTRADGKESKRPSSSPSFAADGHWLEPPSTWKTPPDLLEDDEFWIVFNDCVAHLPRHLAQAFLLREVEGIEVERLRTLLNIRAENLRVRLHRARLLLRACLEKNWFQIEPEQSPRIP